MVRIPHTVVKSCYVNLNQIWTACPFRQMSLRFEASGIKALLYWNIIQKSEGVWLQFTALFYTFFLFTWTQPTLVMSSLISSVAHWPPLGPGPTVGVNWERVRVFVFYPKLLCASSLPPLPPPLPSLYGCHCPLHCHHISLPSTTSAFADIASPTQLTDGVVSTHQTAKQQTHCPSLLDAGKKPAASSGAAYQVFGTDASPMSWSGRPKPDFVISSI